MQSCRHLGFFYVVTSTKARHSRNAQNVINWKRNFKENIKVLKCSPDLISNVNLGHGQLRLII